MDSRGEAAADRARAEAWLAQLVEGRSPEAAALALANLASQVVAELYKRAHAEAQARRGQPEWGRWARLANGARNTALQAASCRDVARELTGRPAPPAEAPDRDST